MALDIDTVLRDHKIKGDIHSGAHEVDKPEFRALLKQIQAGGGQAVTKSTLSALNATTPPNENYMGIVLTGADAGYYYRSSGTWVFGRPFADTFAEVDLSGSGTAQNGVLKTGVSPAGVEVFFARVATPNTGPLALSISGEPARQVVNLAGNPLSAGEWTGMVMFYLNDDGQYQMLIDAGAAQSAAASATLAQFWAEQAGQAVVPDGSITPDKLSDEVIARLGSYLNVMDPEYGVVGDGLTDDWAALNAARDAAVAAGKVLYFPKRVYGISDRWYFADGGDAWFEPGATLKLLAETVSGGAVSGPYPTQTMPINVFNLTVDCDNIAGENGIGFGHQVGAFFHNLTIKNVLHSTVRLGGKALQWEGVEALRGYVNGLNLENCSIGIDIGAHNLEQNVNIGIFNVTMRDVDIPVYFNDTNLANPADNRDSLEVVIDGIQGRNCGAISWVGGTPQGGGLFVMERGYGVTIRNYQFVNDMGGFGSAAYDTIGAVVRGKGTGLILENGLVIANATALFDFRATTMQSPATYDIASYVLADNLRHYGNMDYIIKAENAANIGPGKMSRIEIGSTLASLAGIVEPTIATATAAYLEVIDRDNGFKTTGLQSIKDLYDAGNSLAATLGTDLIERYGAWTPIDASGTGLAFASAVGRWIQQGRTMTIWGHVEYPSTSDTANAAIGGLPVSIPNNLAARAGGVITVSTGTPQQIYPVPLTTTAVILSGSGAPVANSGASTVVIAFKIDVPLS